MDNYENWLQNLVFTWGNCRIYSEGMHKIITIKPQPQCVFCVWRTKSAHYTWPTQIYWPHTCIAGSYHHVVRQCILQSQSHTSKMHLAHKTSASVPNKTTPWRTHINVSLLTLSIYYCICRKNENVSKHCCLQTVVASCNYLIMSPYFGLLLCRKRRRDKRVRQLSITTCSSELPTGTGK